MKRNILSLLMAVLAVACSSGDDEFSSDGSGGNDPEGTISLAMRSTHNGGTNLGDLFISSSDNFQGGPIACVGKVRGVGDIKTIPTKGWSDQVAVQPGYGYVFCQVDANPLTVTFLRIYVEDYICNIANEVLGANIRYQSPFYPSDTDYKMDDLDLVMQYTALAYDYTTGGTKNEYNEVVLYLPTDVYIPDLWLSIDSGSGDFQHDFYPTVVGGQLKMRMLLARFSDMETPTENKFSLWYSDKLLSHITVRYECMD